MAIRDKKMNWTPEARDLSKAIEDAIKPTLGIAKDFEFSLEDWFYLVTHTADDLIIDIALSEKGWANKENQ